MTHLDTKITAFKELESQLKAQKPRPDRMTRLFVASCLLSQDRTTSSKIDALQSSFRDLNDGIGNFQAPSGGLRWIYAAIFSARDIQIDRFIALKASLKQARIGSNTGWLHAGGARAALILAMAQNDKQMLAESFFAMKSALLPSWWRRNAEITDTYAASHVLSGHQIDHVLTARKKAFHIFEGSRSTHNYKRTAARICALHGTDPNLAMIRFEMFDDMRKSTKALRHKMQRQLAIEWACEGLDEADLKTIAEISEQLKPLKPLNSDGCIRLAYLLHQSGKQNIETASVQALAAILAAQVAMMAMIGAVAGGAAVAATSAGS